MIGDVTPSYMYLPQVLPRLRQFLPQARLVVLLRNPIARAVSHHNHDLHKYRPVGGLAARLRREARPLFAARQCRKPPPPPSRQDALRRGLYSEQLARILNYYPAEQVLVVISERFRADPRRELRRVLEFLGEELPTAMPDDAFEPHHVRDVYWAPVPAQKGRLRRALRRFYGREVRRLRRMLDDPLPEWGEDFGCAPRLRSGLGSDRIRKRCGKSGILALRAALWPKGATSAPAAELLEELLQVWIYNSFDLSEDGKEAGAIFLCAAMQSHSCAPNAAWHLDENNSFILHARSFIEEGQEVTISYLSPGELCLPSCDRQDLLELTKGFRCSCSRCLQPLDAARAFCCPECHQEVLAPSEPGDADLVCRCGRGLSEPLAAERRLRPWARSRPEFCTLAKVRDEEEEDDFGKDRTATSLLVEAENAGLADRHWILDALCDAAAAEAPEKAIELLRRRLALHQEGHCMAKRGRLHLALAEALSAQNLLEEAEQSYGAAAELLGLLFGDDHPEHLEAAKMQDMCRRKLRAEAGRVVKAQLPERKEKGPKKKRR
ncbi:unnamed protein product [Effrenium voratum]|nr:unnamed protein product [Effrenium voratum]